MQDEYYGVDDPSDRSYGLDGYDDLPEDQEPAAVCGSGLVINEAVTWTCGLRPHTEGKHHDLYYDHHWLPIPTLATGVRSVVGSS